MYTIHMPIEGEEDFPSCCIYIYIQIYMCTLILIKCNLYYRQPLIKLHSILSNADLTKIVNSTTPGLSPTTTATTVLCGSTTVRPCSNTHTPE